MFHKPIGNFLIGFSLFLLVSGPLSYNVFRSPEKVNIWIALVCLGASQVFAWTAVIKGIRFVKKKEKGFAFNLIAITGSAIIILLFIYWSSAVLCLLRR